MPFQSLTPFPTSLQELTCLSPVQWQAVVASEPVAAAQWMQRGADLGNADAQITLGQWLLDGHGLQRNPIKALAWFLQAAQQGHPIGMNMTGRCFENGWGSEPDYFIASNWYRQAAHKGLDAGMYNLANLLATGKGVPLDHAAALAWYHQAAQQGHAKSKTKIGRYYEVGLVIEKDAEAAFKCFEEGAKGGDFRGQFNYAGMLAARGQFDEALVWLRKVPLSATPGYQREVGPLLLQSPHAAFRAVGQAMLDSIATPAAS